MEVTKNDKKTIKAWAVFDWANSVYALVIATAIFPIYFVKSTPSEIDLFGTSISNNSLYSFAVSFSYIIIAALSPLLSGIADFSGKRKFFLKMFTLLGSIGCIVMYFFKGEPELWLGTSAFILATIGFSGSLVFYDSYLPIITTEDQYDKVSAKGFSYGYVGSVICLVFILFMIQKPEVFGITSPSLPSRIGFVIVGFWWIGFAQYTFKYLPKDSLTGMGMGTLSAGYNEVNNVFKKALKMPNLKRFLASFFLYTAGVQTVVYMATIFADEVLEMETAELIGVVLIIQLIGILGAYGFARVSNIIGNKYAIIIQIVIWIAVCIGAYFCYTKFVFYILSGSVGLVVGGIQALSRSSYSKLLDPNEKDVTSFFSLYDVLYKLSIVMGTFLWGFVNQITGSMRYSVILLIAFFLGGLILMMRVDFETHKRSKLN